MGVGTLLGAAMRQISWGQVADVAMRYGPDLLRKVREQLQACQEGEGPAPAERIRELEAVILRQEEIIEKQEERIALMEEILRTLQARLNIFMTLSALTAVLALVLGVVLLRR